MRIRKDGLHWRIVRISLGIALAILGVAGLFLPVLQGILLLVASVLVLSVDVPVFRRLRRWLSRRFPRVFGRGKGWLARRRRSAPRRLNDAGPPGDPRPSGDD